MYMNRTARATDMSYNVNIISENHDKTRGIIYAKKRF